MQPAHAANLVANSGNAAYGFETIWMGNHIYYPECSWQMIGKLDGATSHLGAFLLTWFNFNPGLDK